MCYQVHRVTSEHWEHNFVCILNESTDRIMSYTRTHPVRWHHNCDLRRYLGVEILMGNLATHQEALEYANMLLLLED